MHTAKNKTKQNLAQKCILWYCLCSSLTLVLEEAALKIPRFDHANNFKQNYCITFLASRTFVMDLVSHCDYTHQSAIFNHCVRMHQAKLEGKLNFTWVETKSYNTPSILRGNSNSLSCERHCWATSSPRPSGYNPQTFVHRKHPWMEIRYLTYEYRTALNWAGSLVRIVDSEQVAAP